MYSFSQLYIYIYYVCIYVYVCILMIYSFDSIVILHLQCFVEVAWKLLE